MNEERKGVNGALLGFGLGVLAGAVTGLLLAPTSGRETRRRIGEVAQRAGDRVRDGLEATKRAIHESKDRWSRAVEEGQEAYERESSEGATSMSGPPSGRL
ncbi:MAG TPA: YtxH domain-containing protein [Terriglobales bacterium]|nr:YtxH domain-containing protein [Terriglobales bacterium]